MNRTRLAFAATVALLALSAAFAQRTAFQLGDAALEASLNEIGAGAAVDLPGFQAELTLTWGVPAVEVKAALGAGLVAGEVYLAAGLASISGKPLPVVVDLYRKNKAKGWGALARELGVKPGSKEFKALKDKAAGSAEKAKKKKK